MPISKFHANPSSDVRVVTCKEIGRKTDMVKITATEQLHSFRSE